jgi:hypothetical protein
MRGSPQTQRPFSFDAKGATNDGKMIPLWFSRSVAPFGMQPRDNRTGAALRPSALHFVVSGYR